MKKEQSLLLETIYYGFGRFGSKIISFFLLPVFTQYLTTADYGILELINTTKSLLIPLLSLELFKAMYRYLLDKSEKPWKIYSVSMNYTLLSSLFFLFLLLIIDISGLISYKFLWLVAAMCLLALFNNFHLQYLRATGNVKAFALIGIFSTVISAVVNIILIVVLQLGYISIIFSSALTSLLSLLFIIFYFKTYRFYKWAFIDSSLLKKMILYTLPLLPNSMSWWIIHLSDRYILRYHTDLGALGIYSIANKFAAIYMLLLTIFYNAWQTHAIEHYEDADRDQYYSKVFSFFVFFQLLSIMAGVTIIKPLVSLMVEDSFASAWVYIPILVLGTFFYGLSSFLGTGYLSSKKTSGAFLTTIYAAGINLLINIIFIPHFRLWAATFSTLIAYFLLFVIRLHDTKKFFLLRFDWSNFMAGLVLTITTLCSVLFFHEKVSYTVGPAALAIWIFLNKKQVKSFYYLIRGTRRKDA